MLMNTRQFHFQRWGSFVLVPTMLAIAIFAVRDCPALSPPEYLPVYGGPTYSTDSGGYIAQYLPTNGVNNTGTAVGLASKYDGSGNLIGEPVVRWHALGAVSELEHLGTAPSGFGYSGVTDLNNLGTAVGYGSPSDVDLGQRAVRWDASGTSATELGHLGTNPDGFTASFATSINDGGAAVGVADKFQSRQLLGRRAVRWDASGTTATELGNLGTDALGITETQAIAINGRGVTAGYAEKYDGSGNYLGERAARWDSAGIAVTELACPGAFCRATAMNDAGTVLGETREFDAGSGNNWYRALRWDEGGTAVTELGHLGTDARGFTDVDAVAINGAGTAVGIARKFDDSGNLLGYRAVRWDAASTAATELPNLGSSLSGIADSFGLAINDAGTAVGYADEYNAFGDWVARRAVYWRADGAAVKLDSLLDPDGGWQLFSAHAISDTGWIAGIGFFDPDGSGELGGYDRFYVMHVPATAVPEPATLVLLALAAMCCHTLLARCKRATRRISTTWTTVSALSGVLAACMGATDANAAQFMGLGDLPGGPFISSASGVSADGSVVVGRSAVRRVIKPGVPFPQQFTFYRAFRWTQEAGMVGLGTLSSSTDATSFGHAVSADGSTVVGVSGVQTTTTSLPSQAEAFRWTEATGMIGLGHLPGGVTSVAYDVSENGSVIVGRSGSAPGQQAFRWTQNSGIVGLGDLPGGAFTSEAYGVSADGTITVGEGISRSGYEAFRRRRGSAMVGLGDLPGGDFLSSASAVSDDGSVVVGYGSSAEGDVGREAFRWTQSGGIAGLGRPEGFEISRANAVSADGSVVVGDAISPGNEAFIWDAVHGMRLLRDALVNEFGLGINLSGWTLNSATGVSADGQVIVGYGRNPSGGTEAWIARLDASTALPGDFNTDGTVDAADYVVWRKGLGTAYDQDDYGVWRAHFGASLGVGSGAAAYLLGASAEPLSAAVPEPASLALLLLVAICVLTTTRVARGG
jgi:probable HAF family extracellular repeat protein